VNLYYLSPSTLKNERSLYAAYLAKSFGKEATLYLVRPRSNAGVRATKFFGVSAFVVDVNHAAQIVSENPAESMVVSVNTRMWSEALGLVRAGAALVVHCPGDLKSLWAACGGMRRRVGRLMVTRKAMLNLVPDAMVVPQPYVSLNEVMGVFRSRPYLAVSTVRVDSDARTHIILEANRLLPEDARVHIRGFDQSGWGKRFLVPKYPEYQPRTGGFRSRLEEGAAICSSYKLSIDVSNATDANGGTRYTFLEAMDSGCILVIHRDWILPDDEMIPNDNCAVVGNAVELAKLLKRCYRDPGYASSLRSRLLDGYQRTLDAHSPRAVVPEYLKVLEDSHRRAKAGKVW